MLETQDIGIYKNPKDGLLFKIRIHVTQNVGKVLIAGKISSRPHLGLFQACAGLVFERLRENGGRMLLASAFSLALLGSIWGPDWLMSAWFRPSLARSGQGFLALA